MYWDKMNDYMRLTITGVALASLLYLSVNIYNFQGNYDFVKNKKRNYN